MARRVAVAASGGRDSTALLHCTCRAARHLGLEVVALHVHHGLMAQADAWLEQVRRQCLRWARGGLPVTFVARRLSGAPSPGDSVEAWARRERYRALAAMAHEAGADIVLLGHHRTDQAETVLLQALRGAGPAGLSAMPRRAERDGIAWCRPWLEQPSRSIDAYVARHRLSHVEDGSNHDARFARSRLRREIWPALEHAFPGAASSLVHAAARAQEAAACLHELGALDVAACGDGAGGLVRSRLASLGPARRANALRHWLSTIDAVAPPDSLVERLVREVTAARSGAWWPLPGGRLRLDRDSLRRVDRHRAKPQPLDPAPCDLGRPGTYEVPAWGGRFVVEPVAHGGVPASLLEGATLVPRRGGERFQADALGIPRSLKKCFQAARVACDDRHGPLVVAGGLLVFVPGLGIDARAVARCGDDRLTLSWQPGG